jgi:hypothetical protein
MEYLPRANSSSRVSFEVTVNYEYRNLVYNFTQSSYEIYMDEAKNIAIE